MSNIIDKIQVSGVTYDIGGGGGVPESTFTAYTANTDSRISQDEEVTAAALNDLNSSLSGKVNVADNIVSAATINYTYDAGDTNYKYPYRDGLRIHEFWLRCTKSWTMVNAAAWTYLYITNNGTNTSQITMTINADNYAITEIVSTSGSFTATLDNGVAHIVLGDGYYVNSLQQSSSFQVSYEKYTIESGQTADVINEDLIDVIQDIYDQVPKAYLTAATPTLNSNNLTITNYKSDGNTSAQGVQFGSSIKGDNNKIDVYFDGQTATTKTLNTGSSNYCQIPSSTVNVYSTGFNFINLFVNTGYTGSSLLFTFTVNSIYTNNNTYTDSFVYDVANKAIIGSQTYVNVTFTSFGNIIHIEPNNNYKILSVSNSNCNIAGVDSYFKNQYIITGVTAPTYAQQGQVIINDLYSKIGDKATTTAVTQAITEATSGLVQTSVYSAFSASTNARIAEDEEVTAAGLNAVNSALGGLKLQQITQSDYNNLQTKDQSTLYIIVN